MPKYIVLSTLTDHGLKTLKENPDRLTEVNTEIQRMGANVLEQWAVLGQYDFVTVIEAPDNATMTRVSVETRLPGLGAPDDPAGRRRPGVRQEPQVTCNRPARTLR